MKTAQEWFDENAESSDINGKWFWMITLEQIEAIQQDALKTQEHYREGSVCPECGHEG